MLTAMFCHIDDFCNHFEPVFEAHLLQNGRARKRKTTLSLSEQLTIVVYFHRSNFRTFKSYYNQFVCRFLKRFFPQVVSYNRFIELMPRLILPLCVFLNTRKGRCSGIAFIDATALRVCHNRRISQHKVFDGVAARGKCSTGWFFGFKLHLVVNDRGELLAVRLTPGNVDDRVPVRDLCTDLLGKLVADKGYISAALAEDLLGGGVELITKTRKNMKAKLMRLWDRLLLRKRALIECVIDHLKNTCQVEHSRHRSGAGFMVNLLSGLVAYSYLEKKPSLRRHEFAALGPATI
ncbi:MAG: IS982 family transposase [Rhodothermales bacterium]